MADTQIIPTVDQDKQTLKDNYLQIIADLETIQTSNLNTTAKLETAVQGMALTIERLLKFIKNRMV